MTTYRYAGEVGIVLVDKRTPEEGGTGLAVGYEPGEEKPSPFPIEHPHFHEVKAKPAKDDAQAPT